MLAVLALLSSACGQSSPAYNAGWNYVAEGGTFLGLHYSDCSIAYTQDNLAHAGSWDQQDWVSGCQDASKKLQEIENSDNSAEQLPSR